jgi:1,4-dihydroxy-2-naphthoyl-CoA hydrolase
MGSPVQAEQFARYLGPFAAGLGLRLMEASGDGVRAELEIGPALHQPYGIVHGGVYCTAVETTASIGAALWYGDRGQTVGVANSTNFLRSARSGRLVIQASPIHRGRTQQLWLVEITNESGRPVARGEVRLANIADASVLGRP